MGGRPALRRISMLLTVALLGLGGVAGGVALADEPPIRDPGGGGRVIEEPGDTLPDDPSNPPPGGGGGGGGFGGGGGGTGGSPTTTSTTTTTTTIPDDGDSDDDDDDGDFDNEVDVTLEDADLEVTKTDSPDPVLPGSNITYTITATNNGPASAENVTLTDVVPTGTTFVSFSAPPGWTTTTPPVGGTGTVTATLPALTASGSGGFSLIVNVNVLSGPISNTATLNSTSPDPDTGDNTDTTSTALASADLSVTKTGPANAIVGNSFSYTIVATNNGPDAAPVPLVTDNRPGGLAAVSTMSPPAGWNCISDGSGQHTCSTPSMAVGATATFTLTVTPVPGFPAGPFTNNVIVGSPATDPVPGNNSSSATTTLTTQADLSVQKTDSPDPVVAGSNLTYSISVTNNGPSTAASAQLSDTLPADTTFVSLMAPAGWSCTTPAVGATGTVSCTNSSVAPGSSVFTLVVNVSPSASGLISNTASMSASTADPNSGNNSATATTTVNASADLSVTKADSPDPVLAGTDLSYSLSVSNAGPSDAQSVSLTDAVPAGTTFVSLTQDTGPAFTLTAPPVGGTGNVTLSSATFAAGASATFTLVVKVDPAAVNGSTITNSASVASSTTDPDPADNSDTENTTVAASADLAVTKADSPDPVIAGTELTYTLTATNNGPSDTGGDVTVTDTLPAGTSFVSATPSAGSCVEGPPVSCDVGPMANGATVTITVVVHVESAVPDGSELGNNASVSSGTSDPNTENNTAVEETDVETSADVALDKEAAPDPVTAGNDLTYTITATNNGPSDAQDVTVTDELPPGTSFVGVTPSQGSCSGTTTVTCDLGTLADGGSATITLVVNVDVATPGGTIITNTAVVSSPEVSAATADPSEENNTASASVEVLAAPKAPAAPERPSTARAAATTATTAAAVVAVPRFTG
jgi:uncharacterized repeat protein (TIGR01451 family)